MKKTGQLATLSGLVLLTAGLLNSCVPQEGGEARTDVNTAHRQLQPDYPVPYVPLKDDEILVTLERILHYLEEVTPVGLVNRNTGEEIRDWATADTAARFARGDFHLVSYEWGVLYAGMLMAGEITGDPAYTDYTAERMKFLATVIPAFRAPVEEGILHAHSFRSVLNPASLDDAGSMCAAMIKTLQAGQAEGLESFIGSYIDHISHGQHRLEDGTLARRYPPPNCLWLDDLFMSVPALARMGNLTGETRYYDDAVKQVLQFSERMFIREKGLFIHGWVQEMQPHPEFYWGRANGWAIMAMAELLDVLPEDHPGRDQVMNIFQSHIKGLSEYQSGSGLWHQLIDRPDSYLETSSSAMFTYATAKAINRGWVDARAYGPMVNAAWNALTTRVNERGQVEGTCVGTGMGFDPVFYYYRPVSPYAAHGYGPMMLAGAEVLKMSRNFRINNRGGGMQVFPE